MKGAIIVTENEAIDFLKDEINGLKEQRDGVLGDVAAEVFWEINGEGRIAKLRTIIGFIEELKRYKGIGTVEECREAVEKQKQKRPIKILADPFEYDYDYICPNCRRDLNDPKLETYCRWCGQAIQWYVNI